MKLQKFMARGVSLTLIIILLVTLAPTSLLAQEAYVVQVDGLLVYEQPSTASTLLAVLSLGVTVNTFPDQVENGFTKLVLPDGREGWGVLTVAGAPDAATDTTATDTDAEVAPPSTVVVESRGNVRIRQTPSINGTRLGFIGWGEQAFLLSYDDSRNWIQINYDGVVGWSAADWFIIVQGNAAAVGTGGVETTTLNPTTPVETTETQMVAPPSETVLVQAVGNVRIRQEPNINSTRLGLAPWGAVATLLGTDDSGDWAFIDYEGLQGWSAIAWWRVVEGTVAVATPPEDFGGTDEMTIMTDSTATSDVSVQALGNVRVRQEPNINGTRLTGMAWGDTVPALAISADGNWLKVNYQGIIGWVARDWFRVLSGNIGGLPVE